VFVEDPAQTGTRNPFGTFFDRSLSVSDVIDSLPDEIHRDHPVAAHGVDL
jgi:hypothetical protein